MRQSEKNEKNKKKKIENDIVTVKMEEKQLAHKWLAVRDEM